MSDVFHENLKAARLRKGLNQQEVADLVGVAKSTYSMWETGNREPNLMIYSFKTGHFLLAKPLIRWYNKDLNINNTKQ